MRIYPVKNDVPECMILKQRLSVEYHHLHLHPLLQIFVAMDDVLLHFFVIDFVIRLRTQIYKAMEEDCR
jgi:hypothetical protein